MKNVILILMALTLAACSGGGGGGSVVSGSPDPIQVPDFTNREYVFRAMGGDPTLHNVTIQMQCNINADSGYRNETINLALPQGNVGGSGCNTVYNSKFVVTNSANYDLYFEMTIDNAIVEFGTIPAFQTYEFEHGYVQ